MIVMNVINKIDVIATIICVKMIINIINSITIRMFNFDMSDLLIECSQTSGSLTEEFPRRGIV